MDGIDWRHYFPRIIGVVILLTVFLAFSEMFGAPDEDGFGKISLLKPNEQSKSFRADADIVQHNGFFWRSTYTVNDITLPNGSGVTLRDCTLRRHERTVCIDEYAHVWTVELNEFNVDDI